MRDRILKNREEKTKNIPEMRKKMRAEALDTLKLNIYYGTCCKSNIITRCRMQN